MGEFFGSATIILTLTVETVAMGQAAVKVATKRFSSLVENEFLFDMPENAPAFIEKFKSQLLLLYQLFWQFSSFIPHANFSLILMIIDVVTRYDFCLQKRLKKQQGFKRLSHLSATCPGFSKSVMLKL